MTSNPFEVAPIKKQKAAYKNPFGIKESKSSTSSLFDNTPIESDPWGIGTTEEQVDIFDQVVNTQSKNEKNTPVANSTNSGAVINQKKQVKSIQNPFGLATNSQPVQQFEASSLDMEFDMIDTTQNQKKQQISSQNSYQQQQQPFQHQNSYQQQQQLFQPQKQQSFQPYQQPVDPSIVQQQFQQSQQSINQKLGFDPNNVDPDNEPPLLVELGLDLESIKIRTLSILKLKKCDVEFLQDPDMGGPIILFSIFGFLLLLSGKLHFGYIYGFGITGTVVLYCIINFLNKQKEIPLYNTLSILGYCIMPVIILASINVFFNLKQPIQIAFQHMRSDSDYSQKKVKGNCCILFLYNLFNLLFLLSALLVIGMGIWLWYEVEKVGPFNLGFLLLGSFQFILALFGQHVRKSKAKMSCYIFFVGLMFIAQTVISSVAIASKDQIVDWAAERGDSPEEAAHIKSLISENVKSAVFATIAAVGIQFLCLWTIYLYRRSFIERNASRELLLKDNFKENQKNREDEIKRKYDGMRAEQNKRRKQQEFSDSNLSSSSVDADDSSLLKKKTKKK